jgi:FMN phosphatase YigB (HAD superfamily)
MKVPSVVVFDLGKVLVDFDYGIASDLLARRAECPPAKIQDLIDHSPLLRQFETGSLSNEEFHRAVCSGVGYSGSFDNFCGIFADIFTEIRPMIDLQAHLRAQGVPTYIFSNTNGIAVNHIRQKFPFFANFDGYIYSYQVGAMKPDPKIYEALERMSGHRGDQIVYLDDREENIEGGRKRGWQVILHQRPEETISILSHMRLPVPPSF